MRLLELFFWNADALVCAFMEIAAIVTVIVVVALYCVNAVVEHFAPTPARSASRRPPVRDDQRIPRRELTGFDIVPEWSPAERSSRRAR